MDDETKQIIQQRLRLLPQEIKDAIRNTDLTGKFNAIAEKHSLRLDQNGYLQTETMLVMLGLEPSEDYVQAIERELGVSEGEAKALAEDVNKEILGSIRGAIRKVEEMQEEGTARAEARAQTAQVLNPTPRPTPPPMPTPAPAPSTPPPPIAPIEKVGNFTVNTPPTSRSTLYNDSTLKKEDVLADLENIKNLKPENAESFVEHLLENPVKEPAPVIQKMTPPPPPQPMPTPPSAPAAPQSTPPERKKYEDDPYREAI